MNNYLVSTKTTNICLYISKHMIVLQCAVYVIENNVYTTEITMNAMPE